VIVSERLIIQIVGLLGGITGLGVSICLTGYQLKPLQEIKPL